MVAAIEIVSPANKDRPEHRNVFLANVQRCFKKAWPSASWIS
jgi:hypothetical protein